MKTRGFYMISAVLFSTLSSCQSKQADTKIQELANDKTNPECESLYNKYIEKAMNMEKDSAVIFLDKSIECDPKNIDYKYAKAQFLVQEKQYEQALSELDKIKIDNADPSMRLYIAILKLKVNSPDSETVLKGIYDELQKMKKLTASNSFYKIALDNYFKGSEVALKEIAAYKTIYTADHELQNIQALEGLIKSTTKEKVLFLSFNIK